MWKPSAGIASPLSRGRPEHRTNSASATGSAVALTRTERRPPVDRLAADQGHVNGLVSLGGVHRDGERRAPGRCGSGPAVPPRRRRRSQVRPDDDAREALDRPGVFSPAAAIATRLDPILDRCTTRSTPVLRSRLHPRRHEAPIRGCPAPSTNRRADHLLRADAAAEHALVGVGGGPCRGDGERALRPRYAPPRGPPSALRVAGAKGFVTRRAVATFAAHAPEVRLQACPPTPRLSEAMDRPVEASPSAWSPSSTASTLRRSRRHRVPADPPCRPRRRRADSRAGRAVPPRVCGHRARRGGLPAPAVSRRSRTRRPRLEPWPGEPVSVKRVAVRCSVSSSRTSIGVGQG